MYRIMIADDEGIVIDSFSYMIKEEFGDDVSIETAKTGRSVIELAERFRPDIALMDIRMPGINGIDAIREIRKRNPGITFIIISAYDKFGYAQEAMSLGVIDYLHKPVERHKFIETIRKAMANVDVDREKRTKELEILEKLETVTPILESGLIYNLLFQDFYQEDILNFKKLLEIEEDYGFMMALVFGDEQGEEGYLTNAVGTSVRLQNKSRDLREIIKSYFTSVIGPIMANKIAIYIPYDKKEMEYNERIEIIDNARNMVRRLNTQLEAVFRVGIGGIHTLDNQMVSYNEALDSLAQSSGSVIHSADLAAGAEYEEDYPVDKENVLFDAIKRGEMDTALVAGNQFFDWMTSKYDGYSDDIKLKTLEFVLRAETIAYEKGTGVYKFRSRQDYLSIINRTESYDKLRKWFTDKISEVCQNVKSRRENRSSGVIDKARDYINANYQKDISLDEVSREINISPYYFSKVFKEATGQNFIDYLTGLRIEKAKELLDNTDMSMKEICVEVGYSNPNYFSRIFKKIVGVSPTEYR
ncbi:two-component system, response regulator YesN [Lachnospiraceae bacterium NE2001]|nr:two-component system, response regulator YesN [Lachnospiraceae bacterium NE2001]